MKRTVVAFCLMMTVGLGAFAQSGMIRELSGTVELKNPGAAEYVPAKIGDTVSQKTVISTGFKSTALIQVGNAVLTVRPLTRLTLTDISASSTAETLNVSLQAGRVRVDVNPPAGIKTSMSVSSPSATASVRGTSFEFDTRNLYVNQGKVSFKGSRGAGILVSAGSSSQIKENNKAAPPIEIINGNLRPPVMVGSDNGGGALGTSVSESGQFSIDLTYPDQ
ncbi:MAG: FecR family protein [Treponema sp.]|jgi:hypothetical protein|nr:FecR family protein [Treponema sp.]